MGLRKKWQPTPVFLPGESHGQRSLVCYSPWGGKESDMTERLHFHFHLSVTICRESVNRTHLSEFIETFHMPHFLSSLEK